MNGTKFVKCDACGKQYFSDCPCSNPNHKNLCDDCVFGLAEMLSKESNHTEIC